VNPCNLRRLENIIGMTGRLLRAYHIEFDWRMLASWIYLIEEWPYRCSLIVLHYEEHSNEFNLETTMTEIYSVIKTRILNIKNAKSLLELDKSERKFEQFLFKCKPTITVSILNKILPFTCNLDTHLMKLVKGYFLFNYFLVFYDFV